jgi:2-oxo-4-hydroxy-4-carboxy-5-ureidoimidazoline decarboxylase
LKASLPELNTLPVPEFVRRLGGIFEHSPWVAEKAAAGRPYPSLEALHAAMVRAVQQAGEKAHLDLLNAHPDLVGKAVLTAESASEQAAAGLMNLSPEEVQTFRTHNQAYRQKFGFPFIICARLNKKEAILAAFPRRLAQDRKTEITTALEEIAKIAKLRLEDAVT